MATAINTPKQLAIAALETEIHFFSALSSAILRCLCFVILTCGTN